MATHEGEDLKRGDIKSATHIYKNVILPLRITKMTLLDLKCWLIHLYDVKMKLQLFSSED